MYFCLSFIKRQAKRSATVVATTIPSIWNIKHWTFYLQMFIIQLLMLILLLNAWCFDHWIVTIIRLLSRSNSTDARYNQQFNDISQMINSRKLNLNHSTLQEMARQTIQFWIKQHSIWPCLSSVVLLEVSLDMCHWRFFECRFLSAKLSCQLFQNNFSFCHFDNCSHNLQQ